MGRAIFGIVAGLVMAFATIAIIEYFGSLIFPRTAPVDWVEQVAVEGWVSSVPIGAKLLVVAGRLLGALFGSAVAGRIARRRTIGWVPVALVAVAALADMTMIPHPFWMTIAALSAPILGGWVGTRLSRSPSTSVMPA